MTAFVYIELLRWLETHQLACLFKKITLLDCPGCGLQRSFVALLKGNLLASLQFHPATIPLGGLVLFSVLQMYYQFKKGAAVIIYSAIFIAVLMLAKFASQFTQ